MRYFETFAGVGGFSLGITNAYENSGLAREMGQTDSISRRQQAVNRPRVGDPQDKRAGNGAIEPTQTCLGFSELDRYASDVLRYHYPETKNYGDITKIDWSTVPDFDLLVGGSPCQSFSIAGKRAGFNGASGLFWEYLRCLTEKKPAYFIWENVKGVLSSNHGYDFANIINSFSEAGYSLWWQVLNAKDFGVPQNRERVFVVGFRDGSPREVFFERKTSKKDFRQGDAVFQTLRTQYPHNWNGDYIKKNKHDLQESPQSARVRSTDGIASTLQSGGGGQGAKTGLYINDFRDIRRLTPIECERLMSWPDDHTKYGRKEDGTVYEMSDSQRYRQCGNGVVSKVVEELFKVHFL